VPSFASTDGPKQAVPIKNKRYQIPRYPFPGRMTPAEGPVSGVGMLVPWTRVSTILDTHEDKEGIFHWTKRLIVKGIGAREDLYALAAATRLEDKAGLLKVADQAFDYAKGQAASNLGTALHGFLERWVEGDKDLVVPSQWKGDVGAVMAAFQDANIRLRPDLQEMVVVRPDLKDGDAGGLAGRLDLVVEMFNPETGEWELIMADYKTGSDPLAYGSWKIQQQLGLYGTAWATWDGEFWRPMPKIRRDKILMVHVLPGQASVQIHIGDVDAEDLEEDLTAAYRTRRRRKEAKKAWRPLVTVEDGTVLGEPTLTVTTFDGGPGPVAQQDVTLVPVGPTKPTPEISRAVTDGIFIGGATKGTPIGLTKPAPMPGEAFYGEAERAAATVARVAAESDPNNGDEDDPSVQGMVVTAELDRSEPIPGPGAEVLAPMADKSKGERGCGVCHRKGHKRGSPKCLGDNDPRLVKLAEQQESSARENAGGMMSPEEADAVPHSDHCRCSTRASGWKAPAVGGGPWVCGDCGLPSKLGVPLSVQFAQNGGQLTVSEQMLAASSTQPPPTLGHLGPDGPPPATLTEADAAAWRAEHQVTAHDSQGIAAIEARVVEQAEREKAAEDVTAQIERHPEMDSRTAEEPDPLEKAVGEHLDREGVTEPDPFDEDGSDALTPAQPSWLERIQQAPDKAELRAIRADAMVVGKWTTELTQAGLKRIEELKLQEQQG
jgi:hypothetical protein